MPATAQTDAEKILRFPENFLWGTATSPTQVEGHIQNEWTDFTAQDGGNCSAAADASQIGSQFRGRAHGLASGAAEAGV